jgi:hypothetical protein
VWWTQRILYRDEVTGNPQEEAIEKKYGIVISATDNLPATPRELAILDDTLGLLPPSLRKFSFLGYFFLLDDDYSTMIGGFNKGNGLISLDHLDCLGGHPSSGTVCVDESLFYRNIVHEILHTHEKDTMHSPYCDGNTSCTSFSAFENAARMDGVTFRSDGMPTLTDALMRTPFILYTQYPGYEWFAYMGAKYFLDPKELQTSLPHLYDFYRQSVFDGRTYTSTFAGGRETVTMTGGGN